MREREKSGLGSRNKENGILKESYITAKSNEKGSLNLCFYFLMKELLTILNGKRQIPIFMKNLAFYVVGRKLSRSSAISKLFHKYIL